MKLKLVIILSLLLFLFALFPLSIYSTILEENNITQTNSTLLNVPDIMQPTNSSSGPAALQAVLAYYGTDTSITALVNRTNTSENGTLPENIAQAARDQGFTAEVRENMTLQDINENINQGIPIIVLCQAWKDNNTGNWTNNTGDGHYIVVIGMDEENIYLEDPAIMGSRGYIPLSEFMERWHDQYLNPQTGNNTTVSHLGIVVTGGQPVSRSPFIKVG